MPAAGTEGQVWGKCRAPVAPQGHAAPALARVCAHPQAFPHSVRPSMMEYSLDGHNVSLSAIRTVRVLRPLRAINRVPSKQPPPHLGLGQACVCCQPC